MTTRPGRSPVTGPIVIAVALVAVAAIAGAYAGASGLGRPEVTPPRAITAQTIEPTSLGPPASAAPGSTPLVRIDPALLAVLPASVNGQSVLESSEGDADASTNSSLARIAESAVGALAIDPGPGDFVLALVVRLKSDVLDDAGYRNWRDDYDVGVCGGGGVAGHAQTQIGGRTVFVATCANGLHAYHAWIPASRLLVSASSGGTANFGEILFGGLTP